MVEADIIQPARICLNENPIAFDLSRPRHGSGADAVTSGNIMRQRFEAA